MIAQLLAHLWGDYILQSEWMAQNKTTRHLPAFVHALLYALLFLPLCWHPDIQQVVIEMSGGFVEEHWWGVSAFFHWKAWLVIFGTHFLIDRYRLARYVVWLKNWMGPWAPNYYEQRMSWKACEGTGYVAENRGGPPSWMQVWLLIIADNTLHLTINYLALRYL